MRPNVPAIRGRTFPADHRTNVHAGGVQALRNRSERRIIPRKEHKRQDHEKDRSRSTLRNRVEYHRSNGRVVWGARLYVDQFRWHVQDVGLSRRVVWGARLYVDQFRWHVQDVGLLRRGVCAMLYVDQFQWHVQDVGLLLIRWSTRAQAQSSAMPEERNAYNMLHNVAGRHELRAELREAGLAR